MSSYAHATAYYDLLYSTFKDYEAEALRLREVIGAASGARRVLDVGCGTGRHAECLGRWFLVDGIDLDPQFVEIAGARNPTGRFTAGDMRSFTVSEPYDVVLCLFGSIGYAATEDQLLETLRCLARAVRAGGLVIVEPWFEPADVQDGYVTMLSARDTDLVVCRVSRTRVIGSVSRLEFQYLVARPSGIEHLVESHDLGLFTRSRMLDAFSEAGLEASFDPEGLMGRGLYVATPGEPLA